MFSCNHGSHSSVEYSEVRGEHRRVLKLGGDSADHLLGQMPLSATSQAKK